MKTTRRLAAVFHSNADDAAFALCLAAFAVFFAGLVGSADPAAVAGPDNKVAATAGRQSPSGDLAGVHADVTPIYRIPGMTVSTSRAVEMARMERESRSARLAGAARGARGAS